MSSRRAKLTTFPLSIRWATGNSSFAVSLTIIFDSCRCTGYTLTFMSILLTTTVFPKYGGSSKANYGGNSGGVLTVKLCSTKRSKCSTNLLQVLIFRYVLLFHRPHAIHLLLEQSLYVGLLDTIASTKTPPPTFNYLVQQ